MTLTLKTIRYELRCAECGRQFDGMDAYDLHIKSTPHVMDAVQVTHVQVVVVPR
jgi:hypothetical protein